MKQWSRRFVLALIFGVAAHDVVFSVRLLTADEPWLAHGHAASWNALSETARADASVRAALAVPYRRLGAFVLHVGVVTLVWGILARNDPRLLTILLVVYTLTGQVLFSVDWAYARGSGYFVVKQVIGALWAIALVAHFTAVYAGRRRRARR